MLYFEKSRRIRPKSGIRYVYLIAHGDENEDHDMVLVDDAENPIYETGYYEEREAKLMHAAVARSALALPISAKDVLRASVLGSMLMQVFRNLEGGNKNDV
jgi:hypothetical protein